MSVRKAVIEDLISHARSGDSDVLERLFTELIPTLREACNSGDADAEELVEATINEAKQRFSEFKGETEAEAGAWLLQILSQQPNRDGEDSAEDADTMMPGPTVGRQPADQFQTRVARPTDAGEQDGRSVDANLTIVGDQLGAGFDNIHEAPTFAAPPDPQDTIAPDPNATMVDTKPPVAAKVPTKTFGDYEILGVIAKGGMGVVYKARQRKLNRVVALKMILAGQFADESDVERFYVEAEASANLRHPNIVGVHEVGECEGQHFFSMDYIEGQSLSDLVREHSLPARQAAEYLRAIAAAMQYSHEQGILHRDLKPANVLVDRGDVPLVTDFGLAKRTGGQSQLTMSGTIVGTPAYMPPEQALGKLDEITEASDVYSLGAILYELLTSRPPFVAANLNETMRQVIGSEPVSPRLQNPTVPADLETICLKCLQKERDRRYTSAQELVDELQRYLDGEPILARPVGPAERLWRWCKRNPRVAWSVAGAFASLLLGFVVSLSLYFVAEGRRVEAREAETLAVKERHKAEAGVRQLLKAINRMYTLMSEERLLNEPGLQGFREQLLIEAKNLYRDMPSELRNDPLVQEELGLAYFRLGRMMKDLNAPNDALQPVLDARQIQEVLYQQNKMTERLAALANTINLHGEILYKKQGLQEAEKEFADAIVKRRQLVEAVPTLPEYERQLVNSQMNSGLVQKALADLEELETEAAHARYERARRMLQEAQAGRDKLLAQSNDAKLHRDSGEGYYNLGAVAKALLDYEEAESHAAAALDAFNRLLATDADEQLAGLDKLSLLDNQFQRALCLMLAGDVLEEIDAARGSYDEARKSLQKLSDENDVHKYNAALAQVHMALAELDLVEDEPDFRQAQSSFETAIGILDPLVQLAPQYQSLLSQCRERRTACRAQLHVAADEYQQAIDLLQPLVKNVPDPEYQGLLDFARQKLKEAQAKNQTE